MLLVDDIQFIIGKESTQEEFSILLTTCTWQESRSSSLANVPQKDIETLEAGLRTGFEWELIADISFPDYETRMDMPIKKDNKKGGHMNELQIFKNEEFGEVRTVTIDNEPWFVGKDVATALGYKDTSDALKKHVSEDDKRILKPGEMPTLKMSNYGAYIINESGLYALIFGSKLGSAKRFKHWVTSEVLPTIRKTGRYQMQTPQGKELLALAVLEARKTIEAQAAEIGRMKPKEIFADAVATSKQSILIGQLAKLICQNGHEIGQKRLFKWMRENGYLMKSGSDYNMPMQRYVEQGLFEIKESSIANPDGSTRLTRTTKVTGKGQQYFINKFLGC